MSLWFALVSEPTNFPLAPDIMGMLIRRTENTLKATSNNLTFES
jgi:hypothetical protein